MNPDMKKKILFSLLIILLSPSLWAQEAHWQFDEGDFQYDMTAVVALQFEDAVINDWSNYEIAAFCGKECRGVIDPTKDILQYGGTTIAYLRVRSNQASGEEITFKVYDKSAGRVINVQGLKVTFQNDDTQGTPANPKTLDITQNFNPGDVNDDGEVTMDDVLMTIDASLGNVPAKYNMAAGDVDGDGEITINDVVIIINMKQ